MVNFALSAISLVLVFCGSVLAQGTLLVQHNDEHDPCSHFKMRILVPADVDHKLPVESSAAGIDPKMVWNPCAKSEIQLAFVPSIPWPDTKDALFPEPPFSFQRQLGVNRNRKQLEFLLTPPRVHSAFPFTWSEP